MLQLARQGISRRTAMMRLAGLVVGGIGVVGSNLVLLSCSQQPATSAAQATPAVSPTSISTSTPAYLPVGMTLYTYRGHSYNQFGGGGGVWTVSWSPDGKRIASAGGPNSDNTAQVWDAVDGSHVYTYRGHSSWVNSVAWSPDGKRLASASDDGTAQVWVAE
jgi:WD40 repeat protein